MASQQSSSQNPSYVFSYLPSTNTSSTSSSSTTSPAVSAPPSPSQKPTTRPTIYRTASTVLASIFQDSFTAPRSMQDQRVESLRQVRAGVEAHMATKRKAGIAVRADEEADLKKIDGALTKLVRETNLQKSMNGGK